MGGTYQIQVDRPDYVFDKNVEIPLKPGKSGTVIRANVYRPKAPGKYPVLCTYGPYGKDIPYADFHPKSYADVNPKHKTTDSGWEVPDPLYWTSHGYAIVRADERGTGQSPGVLDTMSRGTSECFVDVIEWAAEQEWSSGKVGLLGISYYAGTQWRVAARHPKGLAAIIPWEGMSDYYRDRVRHGGILSNTFVARWWNRQVITNQYGLAGKVARNWGDDTLEGDLSPDVLLQNRRNQTIDTAAHVYRDEEYFVSKDFNLEDIQVPLLSVANWGGISLHLRGNIQGFRFAGSRFKFLRCITGRHDLPFFYDHEVELQRSFLNAFLKGEDDRGWTVPGKVPAVDLCLRQGEPQYNNAEDELRTFPRRCENEWPIARTDYQKWHLGADKSLSTSTSSAVGTISYGAPSGSVQFKTAPFEKVIEITGHPTLRISLSLSSRDDSAPTEMDVFVTLRHRNAKGDEVFYTGTSGDATPVVKGWLRASLRVTDTTHPQHTDYCPHRNYYSTDVQEVKVGETYTMDIELWPTNVVINTGGKLVLEVASSDTQGAGFFEHNDAKDRNPEKLAGWNNIHIGAGLDNYLTLPVIPS
ncbi:Alpha/Beta hydrolase protein [Xylariales sp. AK1849]|nr:Alpha/Beta hydrolase protein [Xylariales sp. AK1849]